MATFVFGFMRPHVGMTLIEALGVSPDFYVESADGEDWYLAEHDVRHARRDLVWARALDARFWRAEVTKDKDDAIIQFSVYLIEGPVRRPNPVWDRAIG